MTLLKLLILAVMFAALAFLGGLLLSPAYAHPVIWNDNFSDGFNGWSYVQGADPAQGGPGAQYVYVTTAFDANIPITVGRNVAHFERPASAISLPHAKVYKEWSATGKLDQFGRVEDKIFNNGNVSAIYSAQYYFPKNYTAVHEWVNIFQFKEEGLIKATDTVSVQNPSWWVNVGPASSFGQNSETPMLFINNQGTHYPYKPKMMPLPLGRLFTISANLYSGDRIDWYIDGVKFDTSYNATWPVGRFYAKSNTFIFGVGHYGGIGVVYIDNAGVATLN